MPSLLLSLVHSVLVSPALADELKPRSPLPKHPIVIPDTLDSPVFGYRLTLKFRDTWKMRVDADGQLSSQTTMDLSRVDRLAKQYDLHFSHLIELPPSQLAELEQRAEAYSKQQQPDLLSMMVVHFPSHDPERMVEVGERLQQQPEVEYAYIETMGTPPPGDIGTTTPDYSSQQGYVGEDPGIDMTYMYGLGIKGSNVRVSDCEYGWNTDHEDLMDQNITVEPGHTVPSWVAGYGWDDHGTASIGEISATENAYGATGLAPEAEVYVYPEWSNEAGYRRPTSVTNAISSSSLGDVVLLEMQAQASYIGGNAQYGPAELDPNIWTIVKTGTDAGISVVEAAGNGNQNLDANAYATYQSYGDSGAILVGAGSANLDHDMLYFSTYGSRVNLQGWGFYVFTLGYGDYTMIDNDPNQEYTDAFSGTSSASPIVTAACIAVQDYLLQNGSEALSPAQLRRLLMDTGTPQGSGGNIGPLPDLRNAIETIDSDADGWADSAYGGQDCDDNDPNIHPDAIDTWYDGIDSNCDSADDYDADADGFQSDLHGGTDCDDAVNTTFPGAADAWYDGIDSNCDNADDYDADADGYQSDLHGGTDCDDTVNTTFSGAADAWYDGVDSNCDNADDYDADADGYQSDLHGGTDCDDTVSTTFPGAADAWYDGIDSNCDSADDFDADADGFQSDLHGGTDCDDTRGTTFPGAADAWYDGIDSNCDNADDFDADADGYQADLYGGTDCDDTVNTTFPGAADAWYDGIDSNCDNADDYDADADGHPSDQYGGDDCNDEEATVNPNVSEVWYDGIDSNCDNADDFDADADGYQSDLHGGTDCDDTVNTTFPGAADAWYDGVDSNCDNVDDFDADGDGFPSDMYEGTDCNDEDSAINPDASEIWYDGIDSNCDNADDFDADGDGFPSDMYEGTDCNDEESAINPDASEIWYDGIDSNCDNADDFDADGDGYQSDAYDGDDCDDDNPDVSPAATEIEDGIDNDCSGQDETYDADEDGLNELEEETQGTDPNNPDSDGDGVADGEEVANGTNPLEADIAEPTDTSTDSSEAAEAEGAVEDEEEKPGSGCSTSGTGNLDPAWLLLLGFFYQHRPRKRDRSAN